MAESQRFEEQQNLIEDYQEVVENEPVYREETMVEPVHNQNILQDHHVITSNKEVQLETVITPEDELQDIQLTKCREYDALSLTRRLRFEAELLAKAKAKEEVSACTLQSHIQELQQNREHLGREVLNLQAFKENLQRELHVEQFNSAHVEKQINNTGKIVDMLKQNYEGLEKTYEVTLEDAKKLEQHHENELQKYQVKKEEFQRAIKIEDANLQEINMVFETDNKKYNEELNIKNYTLQSLTEAEVKITAEIADMKRKCDDMKNQLTENEKHFTKVLSQNQTLHNLINSVNLEELETQKMEKQQSYLQILNALEADLNTVKESCNAAENHKAVLLKSLEDEVKIGNELEANYDKLENEHAVLITAQEELNNINITIENKASTIYSLESDLNVTNNNLTKLNDEISGTVQNKKEMIENLHIIHQNNKELQAKLAHLQCLAEKLTKDYELDVPKLAELQQKKADLTTAVNNTSSQLLAAKEKYLDTEKLYSEQLEKVNNEFAEAQAVMDEVKQNCDMKIKSARDDLATYKADTEKTKEKNNENNKQKLQEMEEQLNRIQCDVKKIDNLEQLKTAIKQKEATRQNLQIEFELAKVSSQRVSLKRKVFSENIKPPSILKSPGKAVTSKSVTWRVPTNSSIDTDNSQSLNYWKTPDEFFDALLRSSPPERLEQNKSKRSRLID